MYTMSERGAEPAKGWTDPTPDSKATRETRRPGGKKEISTSIKEFKPEGALCKAIKARDWATAEALVLEDQKHSGSELKEHYVLEKDHEERLPLHLACEFGGSPELVLMLLQNNEQAREGLEWGEWDSEDRRDAGQSKRESVEPPWKRDVMNRTPAHYAAAAGAAEDVLTLLLDYAYPKGQHPTLVRETFHGMTPSELARKKGHDATAEFIDTNTVERICAKLELKPMEVAAVNHVFAAVRRESIGADKSPTSLISASIFLICQLLEEKDRKKRSLEAITTASEGEGAEILEAYQEIYPQREQLVPGAEAKIKWKPARPVDKLPPPK